MRIIAKRKDYEQIRLADETAQMEETARSWLSGSNQRGTRRAADSSTPTSHHATVGRPSVGAGYQSGRLAAEKR